MQPNLSGARARLAYIEGIDRNQTTLFPAVIDEYIDSDSPVRFIEAYVHALEMEQLGFERASANEQGRPSYDPRDLLKLLLYGYLNNVRSSRKLEREAGRNVEVMWLLRRLAPDFKTIADFRRDNLEPIRRACRELTVVGKKLELFGGELVAIDGSKFRAVNSRSRNVNPEGLKSVIEQIDQRVADYLQRLETTDASEEPRSEVATDHLKKKIASLSERCAEARALLEMMDREKLSEISLSDPDSRRMKTAGVTDVCYNVQAAVDAKNHLVVADDVTNDATDREWLHPMAIAAKAALEQDTLTVLADRGYSSNAQVKACDEDGITTYLPKVKTSANEKLGLFTKEDFRYGDRTDSYTCPAGQSLTFRFQTVEKKRPVRYYESSACGECLLRSQCTRNKRNRRISRHADEAALERMHKRVLAAPDILAKRKTIVEHVFGTMKRWMNQGHFLLQTLPKVKTEFSLTVFAYNLRRMLNVVSVNDLLAVTR